MQAAGTYLPAVCHFDATFKNFPENRPRFPEHHSLCLRCPNCRKPATPNKESDDEDVDHSHDRRRTRRRYFVRPGAGDHGFTSSGRQYAKADDGKFPVLHHYVRKRRAELQVFELGSLRERRKAPESELFAQSEQEHDGLQAVSSIVATAIEASRRPARGFGMPALNFCHVKTPSGTRPCTGTLSLDTHNERAEDAMNKDRIQGSAEQAKGKLKEVTGKATGDTKLEGEGKAQKAAGKVQNTIGGMKDALKEAVED